MIIQRVAGAPSPRFRVDERDFAAHRSREAELSARTRGDAKAAAARERQLQRERINADNVFRVRSAEANRYPRAPLSMIEILNRVRVCVRACVCARALVCVRAYHQPHQRRVLTTSRPNVSRRVNSPTRRRPISARERRDFAGKSR